MENFPSLILPLPQSDASVAGASHDSNEEQHGCSIQNPHQKETKLVMAVWPQAGDVSGHHQLK
jgi:hypothetical protein